MEQCRNRVQKKELFRFLIGGGNAVLVDGIAYTVLLRAGFHLLTAKAVSYVCGAVAGFVINKLWTFESRGFSGREIVKYTFLYLFSAFLNASVNKAVLYMVPIYEAGFLCATGVSTVINFIGQKFFVFAKGRIEKE